MKLKALSLKKKSLLGKIIVIIIIIIIIVIVIYIILLLIRYVMTQSMAKDYDLTDDTMKDSLSPYGYEGGYLSVIGDITAMIKYRKEHEPINKDHI
jgi:flagellar basal body-associated protein FliL